MIIACFFFFFLLRHIPSTLLLSRRFRHLFTQAAAAGRRGMTDGVGFSFPLGAILYEAITIDKKMSSQVDIRRDGGRIPKTATPLNSSIEWPC
jgi:hypothetical protein